MARPPIASTSGRPDQEKVRPSTRARAIVFRALRLLAEFVRLDRGARAARELLLALASAWDRRVLDLEGSAEDILTRLQRAGDLVFAWSKQTVQAALARLHEVCPVLFVRVRRAEYAIPFGQLREPCERLDQLERWTKDANGARICRDTASPPEFEINHQLHSGLSRSSAPPASHGPGSAPGSGDAAKVGEAVVGEVELDEAVAVDLDEAAVELDGAVDLADPAEQLLEVLAGRENSEIEKAGRNAADPGPAAAPGLSPVPTPPTEGASAPELAQRLALAREDLSRLGPSIQGMSGDRRAFVAGCIGGDWGIPPEIWAEELATWNCDGCLPPWRDKDLAKKLESAQRNRKRPYGYKAAGQYQAPVVPKPRPENAAELWAQCKVPRDVGRSLQDPLLTQAASVESWLNDRGLSAETLPDVARMLPWKASVPSWATFEGRPWSHTEFRLVLPLYDAFGELVGVRARRLAAPDAAGAKEVLPAGRRAVGTTFASPAAVAMLRGETDPQNRAPAFGISASGLPAEVWIVEGGPDFLTLCTLLPGAAILGVFEGSWDSSLAARIPPHARVILATHADTAGRQYSLRVASSLPASVELRRFVLPEGEDLNSLWVKKQLDLSAHVALEIGAKGRPAGRIAVDAPWTRRAIEMLRRYNYAFEGTSRELARVLFIAVNKRFTNSTVRGLARALERLDRARKLPGNVVLVPAQNARAP